MYQSNQSSQPVVRAFLVFWWTLGLLLIGHSVETAWYALSARRHGIDLHVAGLASVEAIAALLFLVPTTMRAGGSGLLAVFAIAFVLHAIKGELASQLVLYAVAVSFVVVHGRIPPRVLPGGDL